ncbi:MAG: T9SS type A sorting domain-containing protein [bacterium]
MHGATKRFLKSWISGGLLITLVSLTFIHSVQAQTETLRFMAWNILNYTYDGVADHHEDEREPYYRTVISTIDPDIISVEEVWSGTGSTRFLSNVLDVIAPGKWAKSLLSPTSSYDVQLYYRTDRGISLGPIYLITAPIRDIVQFQVNFQHDDLFDTMYVFITHLKASNNSADESTRTQQINAMITQINNKSLVGSNLIFCGDFNLYRASGTAWQAATSTDLFRDPINRVGSWTNNSAFADVHTQSTRTSSTGLYDEGATGGLDDRFDFILASPEFFDSTGLDYLPESYHAFGNDGQHFNLNINYPENLAVRREVADALYYASDHLPVVMDIAVDGISGVRDDYVQNLPSHFMIVSVYPNPFNSTASVSLNLRQSGQVHLALYNLLGRQVWEMQAGYLTAGAHHLTLPADKLSSGVYLLRTVSGGSVDLRRVTLIR